jgi:hypothetical protein
MFFEVFYKKIKIKLSIFGFWKFSNFLGLQVYHKYVLGKQFYRRICYINFYRLVVVLPKIFYFPFPFREPISYSFPHYTSKYAISGLGLVL